MSPALRPFVPPTYPFDLLEPLEEVASRHEGGMVDLSVGTPCDAPPDAVVAALSSSGAERGYPAGVGSNRLLDAARGFLERNFSVSIERSQLAASIGTKEFVAGLPHWLKLRSPERDTVLYPEVSYPTYEIGALLANCRAVPVSARADGSMALDQIDEQDAARALCLWVNSPSNPTGQLDDLDVAADWGRRHGVLVCSDECYADYTWQGRPRSILENGSDGLLALHSISKRSNCAGLRVGIYAGDGEVMHYLRELRRHAGFMVPGPVQLAGAIALEDDAHVLLQRQRYLARLERFVDALVSLGVKAAMPAGSFYLWISVPDGNGEGLDAAGRGPEWAFVQKLAEAGGVLVSPGEFYGPAAHGYVRIAMVQPDERIDLGITRLLNNAAQLA